jgi:CHASE1-domain containing sensor protein
MTNLAMSLWLASITGSLREIFLVAGVVGFIASAIVSIIWTAVVNEGKPRAEPFEYPPLILRRLLYTLPVVVIVGALLPSTTTVKQMIGVTYAERLLTDPKISQLADPAADLVKEYLQQQLKQLRSRSE